MKKNETAIRVLVADDEPLINWGISRFIKKRAIVNSVASAEEALAELGNQQYDLCLLDFNLPAMSGLEAMKIINRRFPETKVAIMSGSNIDAARMEQIDRDAYAFIEKPFDLSQIKDVIERTTNALTSQTSR